jgi:5'-deoxynucleotidase YfbR-like HD superfamily hydrolase
LSIYANLFFEVGMLARTPRSGFPFLGTGKQSVAEHVYRMLNIAFILARQSDHPVDELHLLHLVLFHDLPEARTGDHATSDGKPKRGVAFSSVCSKHRKLKSDRGLIQLAR